MKSLILFVSTAILITATSPEAFSQIRLKEKLERKANQEIDKLLFGKKKGKKNQEGLSYDEPGSEKGERVSLYEKADADFSGIEADEAVPFRVLIDFLPERLEEYSRTEDPEGATMNFMGNSYSFGSKEYSNGSNELSLLIYDYLLTGQMMATYANQYSYESTEGKMVSIEIKGFPGWYQENYDTNETNLMLAVNGRFMIFCNTKGGNEKELTRYISQLDIESLPKGAMTEDEEEN